METTTLGFATNNIDGLIRFAKKNDINYARLVSKCMENALRASYHIFCMRNKDWVSLELLYFPEVPEVCAKY